MDLDRKSLDLDLISSRQGELPLPVLSDSITPLQVADPPLQVYKHSKNRSVVPWASVPSPTPSSTGVLPNPSNDSMDLPIALRKGTRTCTQHPISNSVSFDRLSSNFRCFVSLCLQSLFLVVCLRHSRRHAGSLLWMRTWLPYTRIRCGSLLRFLLGSSWLVAGGCT